MGLLERYLDEIARRLPRRQRDDVRRELRSALADALDSRVAGEATEGDVVALLREFGSPRPMALMNLLPDRCYAATGTPPDRVADRCRLPSRAALSRTR